MHRLLLAPLAAILLLVSHSGAWAQMTASAYDYEFEAIEGGKLPLSQWRNKVLLVVNVASFCGFTQQYEGLQKLWERYQARGLVVVGVPANDFGAQEPKSESEILEFCQGAFGVNFPMTTKQTVVGGQAHPFYLWARDTPWPHLDAALEFSQISGGPRRQADRRLRLVGDALVRYSRQRD